MFIELLRVDFAVIYWIKMAGATVMRRYWRRLFRTDLNSAAVQSFDSERHDQSENSVSVSKKIGRDAAALARNDINGDEEKIVTVWLLISLT